MSRVVKVRPEKKIAPICMVGNHDSCKFDWCDCICHRRTETLDDLLDRLSTQEPEEDNEISS